MLNQEIGWFDLNTNTTGALTGKLSSEAAQVMIFILFLLYFIALFVQ